jgi:hypothetical protein
VRAHSLGAVHISVLGIAHALSALQAIPFLIGDSVVGVRLEVGHASLAIHRAQSEVVDVLAGSVAGAVIGARRSGASLAFVTVKALAKASSAVADTLTRALSVVVEGTQVVGGVYPSNLEGAHTVGAISTLAKGGTKTNSPVVIALANIIDQA